MTDFKPDENLADPMVKNRPEDTIFQAPYSGPPAKDEDDETPAEKPAKKSRDEMTPAEKAADTRAKNERREKREARKAEKDAELANEESAESAGTRTWSCPQCGRGTTLGAGQQPPTVMRCDGCGRDIMGDTWLPPGVGHGEPTLQVSPPRP